ncbi:MAG: hypothetical protein WCD70_04075 [Alphaproteobacteria bacterium]
MKLPRLQKMTAKKRLFILCSAALVGVGGYFAFRVRDARIDLADQWMAGKYEVASCQFGHSGIPVKISYRGLDQTSKEGIKYGFLDGDCNI